MIDIKKTVKFTADVQVLDASGNVEFEAMAGDVVELSAASAKRWIRRNKAVESEKPKSSPTKKAAQKKRQAV